MRRDVGGVLLLGTAAVLMVVCSVVGRLYGAPRPTAVDVVCALLLGALLAWGMARLDR